MNVHQNGFPFSVKGNFWFLAFHMNIVAYPQSKRDRPLTPPPPPICFVPVINFGELSGILRAVCRLL